MSTEMATVLISDSDVLREMSRLFPAETRIAVLTATNAAQAALIREQDEIIRGQRAEANEDVWKNDPARGDK